MMKMKQSQKSKRSKNERHEDAQAASDGESSFETYRKGEEPAQVPENLTASIGSFITREQ